MTALATGTARLKAASPGTLHLRLTKAGRKALRHAKRLKATLSVSGAGAKAVTKPIGLRR